MSDEVLWVIALIGAFWVGFRLGHQWAVYKLAKAILAKTDLIEDIVKELKEEESRDLKLKLTESESNTRPEGLPEDAQEMEVFNENGVYYLFRKSNNQFLGQGATLKGAMETVKDRFPNETFWGGIEKDLADKWGTTKEVESQKS